MNYLRIFFFLFCFIANSYVKVFLVLFSLCFSCLCIFQFMFIMLLKNDVDVRTFLVFFFLFFLFLTSLRERFSILFSLSSCVPVHVNKDTPNDVHVRETLWYVYKWMRFGLVGHRVSQYRIRTAEMKEKKCGVDSPLRDL